MSNPEGGAGAVSVADVSGVSNPEGGDVADASLYSEAAALALKVKKFNGFQGEDPPQLYSLVGKKLIKQVKKMLEGVGGCGCRAVPETPGVR